MGWFDGAEKKSKVAKGGDKDKSKDKDDVDQGPPRGVGPQVTPANFEKAAKKGKTLAEIEKFLGPGLLLRGAEEEKAKKRINYPHMRSAVGPAADCYQWQNNQEYYYIFIDKGVYRASGGDVK
jgi:hypothetical protein